MRKLLFIKRECAKREIIYLFLAVLFIISAILFFTLPGKGGKHSLKDKDIKYTHKEKPIGNLNLRGKTTKNSKSTGSVEDFKPNKGQVPVHSDPSGTTRLHMKAFISGTGVIATNIANRQPAIFNNRVENFICSFADRPNLPKMIFLKFSDDEESEKEIYAILNTPVTIYDDDSEYVKSVKESVTAIKRDILETLAEGHAPSEVLNRMREENNRLVQSRFIMQRELNRLIKSGEYEKADEFYSLANSELSANSLPPLSIKD